MKTSSKRSSSRVIWTTAGSELFYRYFMSIQKSLSQFRFILEFFVIQKKTCRKDYYYYYNATCVSLIEFITY